MKKTTYWVMGMFVTAFLFSIGVMIYFKYFDNSITPISAKFTVMNVNNVKVLKIDDGNTNNHRSYYNLEIVSGNNDNTNKIAYPKSWIKAVQKGDTLILSLPKDEKDLEKLHNNPPTLVFSIAQPTKTIDLILGKCISDTKFMGLKLNQCSIKGSSYSDITIQTCTIDKFDIAAGGNVQVPDSKIKFLQLLVDNNKLINATKYNIENLYLIGSNDNDNASEIDLTKIKHVYIKPSKGKTIVTRTSSDSEIYLAKD
jgi:hypothetical protein